MSKDNVNNGEGKYWREWILNRPMKNKNCLIMVVGSTGSGKSYACLRCAELLQPSFSIKHAYFNLQDLYKDIDNKVLKMGDVIILEEIGVSAGSRKWQSKGNISFSEVVQTFRTLKLIVFINLPMRYMADSHIRSLMHGLWTMQSIDQDKCIAYIKPFVLQFNSRSRSERDSCYEKYLRIKKKNDWGFESEEPVKSIGFKKPSNHLIVEYEKKKEAFVRKLVQSKLEVDKKVEKKLSKVNIEKRNANLKTKPKKDIDIELYKEYMKKGISKTNIGKLFNMTSHTLNKRLKEYNIKDTDFL